MYYKKCSVGLNQETLGQIGQARKDLLSTQIARQERGRNWVFMTLFPLLIDHHVDIAERILVIAKDYDEDTALVMLGLLTNGNIERFLNLLTAGNSGSYSIDQLVIILQSIQSAYLIKHKPAHEADSSNRVAQEQPFRCQVRITPATVSYQEGKTLLQSGDYPGAIAKYDEALRQMPNSVNVLHQRALAYRRWWKSLPIAEGDRLKELSLGNASRDLQLILKLEPHNCLAMRDLGVTYRLLNKYSEAIHILRRCIQEGNYKDQNYGHYELGVTLEKAGYWVEAKQELEISAKLDNPASIEELINVLLHMGWNSDVAKWRQRLNEIEPNRHHRN